MNLQPVQDYLREQKIDGWLIYDFRGNNPVLAQLLPGKRWTSRRAVLFVPAQGEAKLLVNPLDAGQYEGAPVARELYISWEQFRDWLAKQTAGKARVAMEYAPGGALPVVSVVDAGTVELVRALGLEVVSSANLIQVCVARWSDAAVAAHAVASAAVGKIKDEAFAQIGLRVKAQGRVAEHEIQQFIMRRFAEEGLETDNPPIVAANAHSGDPHYEPSAEKPAFIQPGDWVLIDLWARKPGDENIFSDITWTGFVGNKPSEKHREIFNVVTGARDAALERAAQAWKNRESVQGWQLDDAARNVIVRAGHEKFIKHRTGHSLSPGPKVHGIGFNLDNLETHDTREMLPGLGFTIEPGVYLPEFGVRSEINVFVDPQRGPMVTSGIQREMVLIA